MQRRTKVNPAYWASAIFILANAFNYFVLHREKIFFEEQNIYVPPQPPISIWPQPVPPPPPGEVPLPAVGAAAPVLIYFAIVVVVLGVVLFLVPVSFLRVLLRISFGLLFSWASFIIVVFWLPLYAAISLSVVVGLVWYFLPRVWLHNIVLLIAMVSLAAVFGPLVSPWTMMIILLAIALYDFLAVRFGYMLWMAKKLSQSYTLPAFIIPHTLKEWNNSLKEAVLTDTSGEDRKYSILGGGDIGFPLLLVSAVFFADGFSSSILVALFALFGLISAYVMHMLLKGRPIPALPPIAGFCLLALLILTFII